MSFQIKKWAFGPGNLPPFGSSCRTFPRGYTFEPIRAKGYKSGGRAGSGLQSEDGRSHRMCTSIHVKKGWDKSHVEKPPPVHMAKICYSPPPISAHKTFRIKQKLAKKLKQNRPIPQWVRMRTDNTISRYVVALGGIDTRSRVGDSHRWRISSHSLQPSSSTASLVDALVILLLILAEGNAASPSTMRARQTRKQTIDRIRSERDQLAGQPV
uniref:Large ribosomal subunit protein eL39 n=1 Tax=Timema tahoe TaxID=61484 RepID=A0A7R9INX1_9NEOP|nr:unnamed protein product [Timema tahoe]